MSTIKAIVATLVLLFKTTAQLTISTFLFAVSQIKAIVATQRDYGRRDDRRQSRLKYLIHEWGVDKFRCVCVCARFVWLAKQRVPAFLKLLI